MMVSLLTHICVTRPQIVIHLTVAKHNTTYTCHEWRILACALNRTMWHLNAWNSQFPIQGQCYVPRWWRRFEACTRVCYIQIGMTHQWNDWCPVKLFAAVLDHVTHIELDMSNNEMSSWIFSDSYIFHLNGNNYEMISFWEQYPVNNPKFLWIMPTMT